MRHRATPRFWKCFNELPLSIQQVANQCFRLLKQNPRHTSLHFKKVGAIWSVRVGLQYRALSIEQEQDIVWFWIGTHAEYDRIVGRA